MPENSTTFALVALFSLACGDIDARAPRYTLGGGSSNDSIGGSGSGDAVGGGGATAETSGSANTGGVASGGAAAGGAAAGGTSFGSMGVAAGGGMGTAGTGGVGGGSAMGGAGGGGGATLEWLPSWATSIQSTETNNLPPPLQNNTLRQFVWPTVSGQEIRIQLSNEKGATPLQIQKVHIARALTQGDPGNSGGQIDTSTDASFTFGGAASVTIPAGATVWSDALAFSLQEIQLTAITMQLGGGVPTLITGHPGARTTSYVANGDAVSQQALAGAQTRDRWYFINAIEVMAPAEAFAIAVLGDSITDGFGVLNDFARWPDFLTLAIQDDAQIADTRSVLNFGMGANNLTVSGEFQDAGVVRFERDVLTRDKIKWLIVLEGINDIVFSNVQAQPIINAYSQIIQRAHERGILVYGSPITPTDQGSAAIRGQVNDWIRTSGEFDVVIDLEAAIRDPNNANGILAMFNNDGLHPNAAGYEAMGNAVDLSLFYETLGN